MAVYYFSIDFTYIGARLKAGLDKAQLLHHFEAFLAGDQQAKVELNKLVTIATNAQYQQGL